MKPIIILFVLVCLLALSRIASADYAQFSVGSTPYRACTADHACDKGANAYSFVISGEVVGASCRFTYSDNSTTDYPIAFSTGDYPGLTCPDSCPVGEEKDPYTGQCVQQECPAGQINLGDGCENICQQGDTKKAAFECGKQPEFYQSDTFEGGSCKYEFTDVASDDVYFGADDKVFCDITWTGTGDYIEDTPSEGLIPEANLTDNQTKDTRETNVEEFQGNTTSETLPDGSTKTTENSTKTEIKEQGTVVWNDGQNLYIQSSDGAITEYNLKTETITNPDGSVEKIYTNEWTYTAPDKTTVTFNAQGQQVNTSKAGQDDSGAIVKKEYYASNGAKTGEETTSTGGSSTDGECTGANCQEGEGGPAAGQPSFAVGDGSWWESDYPNGLTGIWESKQEALTQTAFNEWLESWTFASSGSIPTWSFSMNLGIVDFGSFQLEVPDFVWSFIGLCMILTALFTARALIFGG